LGDHGAADDQAGDQHQRSGAEDQLMPAGEASSVSWSGVFWSGLSG